jgi:hypothetical protein
VVKSGEVALLPSWYHKTAVAGSRIARIWIIAASDDPSKGPALGTKYSVSTVKDDKVSINIYKFERYLVVNFVPNVCRPAGRRGRSSTSSTAKAESSASASAPPAPARWC